MARLERFCAGMVFCTSVTLASFGQATPPSVEVPKVKAEAKPSRNQEPPKSAIAVLAKQESDVLQESAVVRVIAIKHCNADDLARVLQIVDDALGTIRIATEMSTNSLIIAGDENVITAKILPLLTALDRPTQAPAAPASDVTATIRLQHANAMNVVQALQQLSGELGGLPNRRPTIRVVGDTRTNTVLVVGTADRVKQFENWARELDTTEAPPKHSQRELRYYVLKSADSRMLGKTVAQTLGAMSIDVPVISDPATDTLIAIGTKDEHELVAGIVAKLDVPAKNRAVTNEPTGEPKPEPGAGSNKH